MSVLLHQVLKEFYLDVILRREFGVSAFTRKGVVAKSVPVKAGFTQSGAGGNYSDIALRVARTFANGHEIFGLKRVDAVGEGLEVINQSDSAQFQLRCEFARVDDPRQIGNFAAASADRTSNSKTG